MVNRGVGVGLVSSWGKEKGKVITPVLPQEVPEGPWQTIGVDMIVGLPESKGKNAILTVVDHYTKQVHLYPVTDGLTALGVADIYFHDVFPLHGIPKKIVSDRGPQFASRILRSILKRLGVDAVLRLDGPCGPQWVSRVEVTTRLWLDVHELSRSVQT